ncbi:cytochrome P450 [Actinoalloteichus hymeniacidonis]|uniref:Cytochrome P450 n=1 Tax=Actinoalloteichus hymeniacidonis TaxID=340345 RepID=A0AAC9HTT9_9PSEU|nr:cytochrome P450 [Actinoalloteichus hymeniacidonis]AOS64791.1 cytochrome P450 [Actinoalloteichus hymeniacidonis]MBB5907134.1 pentalenolactone synthase [Actinoalloteichus hymeniacidonis]
MTTPVQLTLDQSYPFRLDDAVRRLQREACIHRVRTAPGDEAWLVTGHRQVRRLLDDPRLGRSHPAPDEAEQLGEPPVLASLLGGGESEQADSIRFRKLLQPLLSPRRVHEMRSRIEAITAETLDRIVAAGSRHVDLQRELAAPLPATVLADLLGVPENDRAQLLEWNDDLACWQNRAQSEQGLGNLIVYGRQLAAEKRRCPTDDVISQLVSAEGVDDDEASRLALALLVAGAATTMALGLGIVLLLENPEQLARLRHDPQLIPGAVEEILRALDKGGDGIVRYARTDLEVDGLTIRAGELLLLDAGSANHDPNVFREPQRFDVGRRENCHLTFGHGSYYCLGSALARVELQIAFEQLLARFPDLRLAVELEELRLNREVLAGGLMELPVTW